MKKLFTTLSLAAAVSLSAGVLATVNKKDITKKDVNSLMRGAVMSYDKMPVDSKKKMLDQAIDRVLLVENAKKSGVEKDKEFKAELAKLKETLALDVWMKKEFEKVSVSSSEAKSYYEKNKAKFTKPARVKARHILLKSEKDAKNVIAKLKGLGGKKLTNKFISLAKSKSTGPSGKNGGDLGYFAAKQMVPAFSKAAFGLKKGQITKKPVKTQFGYHVILKEDEKKAQVVPFKDMEKNIINGLKMEKFRANVSKKAKDLRKGAKVEIKDKSLKAAK